MERFESLRISLIKSHRTSSTAAMFTQGIVVLVLTIGAGASWPPLLHPVQDDYVTAYQDPYASPCYAMTIQTPISEAEGLLASQSTLQIPYLFHDDTGAAIDMRVMCSLDAMDGPYGGARESANDFLSIKTDSARIAYAKALLRPLSRTTLKLQESWWTYEYHHLNQVKQVHSGLLYTTEHLLGEYQDGEAWFFSSPLRPSKNISTDIPAITIGYTHGEICDATGMPRTTMVEFRCRPDNISSQIVSFQEYSSCKYWMLIETPLLCSDLHFSRAAILSQALRCTVAADPAEILTVEQYAKSMRMLRMITNPSGALVSKLKKARAESESDLPKTSKGTKDPFEAILNVFGFSSLQSEQETEAERGSKGALSDEPNTKDSRESDASFQFMYLNEDADVKDMMARLMHGGENSRDTADNSQENADGKRASAAERLKEFLQETAQKDSRNSDAVPPQGSEDTEEPKKRARK